MQVQKINNCSLYVQNKSNSNQYNINTVPQFRGTVSPEFVKYVNELREDCLQTVPKRSANLINNVCDSILEKSNEIMKKCFPPTSVLSVTKKYNDCGIFGIEDGILKKYGCPLIQANWIGETSPLKRLKQLHNIIISDKTNVFRDSSQKQLQTIMAITDLLKYNYYNKFNECFSDFEYFINWWDEHMDMLPQQTYDNVVETMNNCNSQRSDFKEHRQKLIQNRSQTVNGKNEEMKSVTEHLFDHLRETVCK